MPTISRTIKPIPPPFNSISTLTMGKSKSSPATKAAPEKARKSRALPANLARDARQLLDTMAQSETIADVLSDVLSKIDGVVSPRLISQIEVAQQAASNIYQKGRTAATKISKLPLAVKAYDVAKAAEAKQREALGEVETRPVGKLRAFNRSCKNHSSKSAKSDATRTGTSNDAGKENRSSPRTGKVAAYKESTFTGAPPAGKKKWSREDIVAALSPYQGKTRKEMISAMLKKGKCGYKSDSGIYLLLKNTKNGRSPRARGRPRKFEVQSIVGIAQAKATASPGKAVKLADIKAGIQDERAKALEAVGVSPHCCDDVGDRSTKVGLIAAAMMDGFDLGLSDKKLLTQTETRYIASHSIRSMMAYLTTVLATHFLPGSAPSKGYEQYDPSKLTEDAAYTLKQAAGAYGVANIFPVNPNLVLSTDDTTVFAFSGASTDGSDWSWKFLSASEESGHLSDYEVGSSAEHSGGLRVRLTFTFTASGLMAPPYVAVTGLTEEELPAEACPDGILVQEIHGLCRGGSNDVFAEGSGWLVLLRADKKADRDSHARKFTGNMFQHSSLVVPGKKLNKVLFKGQTASQIEEGCDAQNPCLVWLAWSVRSDTLMLKQPIEPTLEAFIVVPNPTYVTTYGGDKHRPTPTECLRNASWVAKMAELVKGTTVVEVTDDVVLIADALLAQLSARLNRHIDERVHKSKYNHFTLKFASQNLPVMSALVALCGHVTDDLESEDIDSCLLRLPTAGVYEVIAGDLNRMEGCYLYYDSKKGRWIRSGKTSGAAGASFEVRGGKHLTNAQKIDEMRGLEFYRKYPARGVPNLGGRKGYFDNLVMYCALAFNRTDDLSDFCPKEADEDYFVWSQGTIAELIKRSSPLEHLQLDMIAYLWELVYDLMLGKDDNVSQSPGFEALGLRVNESGSKRKRTQG